MGVAPRGLLWWTQTQETIWWSLAIAWCLHNIFAKPWLCTSCTSLPPGTASSRSSRARRSAALRRRSRRGRLRPLATHIKMPAPGLTAVRRHSSRVRTWVEGTEDRCGAALVVSMVGQSCRSGAAPPFAPAAPVLFISCRPWPLNWRPSRCNYECSITLIAWQRYCAVWRSTAEHNKYVSLWRVMEWQHLPVQPLFWAMMVGGPLGLQSTAVETFQ